MKGMKNQMNTTKPKTYVVRTYTASSLFENVQQLRYFLKDSLGLVIQMSTYTYDDEKDMVYLIENFSEESFSEEKEQCLPPMFTTDALFRELKDKTSPVKQLCIQTRKMFDNDFLDGRFVLLKEKVVTDWPGMITDLHNAGKIKVQETKSIFAVDRRRFYFVGDSEDTSVDVDFLGTEMSFEESDRVIEEWLKL